MPAANVQERPHRMEAVFFASDGYHALERMRHSGFELSPMKDLARIIWFGPFARKYVDSRANGLPFLTSSTMMEALPKSSKLVSIKHTKHLDSLRIYEGYMLVSCSGSVGNVMLCTRDVHGWACSQDAIRVIAKKSSDTGLVYCFLQSGLGQFLLQRSQTGSVIRHLYEDDISSLPVPNLPRGLICELDRFISLAAGLRVEANRLLSCADGMIYSAAGIEREALDHSIDSESFCIRRTELEVSYEQKIYHRLESTYRSRCALRATDLVRESRSYARLIDVTESIPFTGPGSLPGVNKVTSEFGVGSLTGRDLGKARPKPSYYLSSRKRSLVEQMIPKRGTTLVLCAGTLGGTDYVRKNYENWAVSLDVIRVNPSPKLLAPGYIYAFLSSDLGQHQMLRHKYGSVIPRIHSRQVAEILVPLPDDRGAEVASIVDLAFDKRQQALEIENQAITLFQTAIEQGRQATEAQWGQ